MSNEPKLGTIPAGDEGRDAVHIAIVPAVAAQLLVCGSLVRLNSENEAEACDIGAAIGVVDPFREDRQVRAGAWFWLCLFPKTITGLRHVWEHPSFPLSKETEAVIPIALSPEKLTSEAWLKAYIQKHCPYWEGFLQHGYEQFLHYVIQDRSIYYAGTDCHSLEDVEDSEELFRHLSVVLGKRIDASYFQAFTCAC